MSTKSLGRGIFILNRWVIASVISSVLLLSVSFVLALEPPPPGEIERLRLSGELPARLEQARALGNHLIDPYLLEQALTNAKREVLAQQGHSPAVIDQEAPLQLLAPPPAWRGMPTTGQVKMFALLIDFSDYPAYNSKDAINSALFGDGSLIPVNSAPYESLTSYYNRSSYNQLDLSSGVTLGWYRPAYTRASMLMDTRSQENLIKEAIAHFKAQGQDFSQFDNNGDETIDYFAVIWTGPDNGWTNFWWGTKLDFTDSTYKVDGKKLGLYSWQWEYNSGGIYSGPFSPLTVIHETGHALGLPDYYDYNGPREGVGGLDMMDSNKGDHNSFSKWVLGWLTPTVVASGSQTLALSPSGTSKDAVLVMPGATSADPFREFFIAQNRYRAGNDLNAGYPSDGMLIWHVDARLNACGTNYLYNNSGAAHKLLKLMQADGGADAAVYYREGKTLTPLSTPSSFDNIGVDSRVNVSGISPANLYPEMFATFSLDEVSTFRTLRVVKSGSGFGMVNSSPAGIACGDDCGESFAPGLTVILTAIATPGSVFTGWSGDGCSGGSSTCVLTVSADVTVVANFSTNIVMDENFNIWWLPTGWTLGVSPGINWDIMDSGCNVNGTGGNGAYLWANSISGQSNDYIELRTSTLNLTGFACAGLEFKTALNTAAAEATLDVDISVNGSAGPWTNVWRKSGYYPGPATVNIDLSASAAGNSNVMIYFHNYGPQLHWRLDDVKVTATATCLPGAPASVFATAGDSRAIVSFTAPAVTGGAITGYTVISNPTGGVDLDAGSTATSHLVTGLSNGIEYTFSVAASTASGTGPASSSSNSIIPGLFTILNENFDSITPPTLPAGWLGNVSPSGTGSPIWKTSSATVHPSGIAAHSGPNLVYFNSYSASIGATATLVSRAFSLTGFANSKVTFWIYRHNEVSVGHDFVNVYINTSATRAGATLLGTGQRYNPDVPSYPSAGSWYKYEFTIPGGYTGGTNYLLFEGVSQWGTDIHLDDIIVTGVQASTAKIGVFDHGTWYLDSNQSWAWEGAPADTLGTFGLGLTNAYPVVGDWNGDGNAKIGVFTDGIWYLDMNRNWQWDDEPVDKRGVFGVGLPGAIPVVGDWTGDGITKIGVYMDGTWYLDMNNNWQWDGELTDKMGTFGIGLIGEVPVVGDWNGNGIAKIGVYMDGLWYLDMNNNWQWDGELTDKMGTFGIGLIGEVPVVGDWNADGIAEIGVYQDGLWYLDKNRSWNWNGEPTDQYGIFGVGLTGAVPVTGKW